MTLLPLLATLVDFGGTLVVVTVAFACLRDYLRTGGSPPRLDALRLRLAGGLVLALTFKTGAGVIRTISVGTWRQLAGLLLIIALRVFLGRVLKGQLARRRSPAVPTHPRPA